MSKTSWAQLDIVVLNKGIGKTVNLLKKMPRAKKQTTQYKEVNEIVDSFRKSIPLIQSLKNDAMQPRHWQELMKVTGVKFNANSTTFTLQSIFDMGLSKFSDEIAEVVNVATQEMKIQKNLQEIEEVWRKESFDLVAYVRLSSKHVRSLTHTHTHTHTQVQQDDTIGQGRFQRYDFETRRGNQADS